MSTRASQTARQRSLTWKIGYLLAIALLLMPLYWLGHPAIGPKGEGGGQLAQLRKRYGLNQADLGQIDPSTETLRLATLGMRGVACNLLWWKATDYQMKEDWTNLRGTLEQISRLQPHSITVWRYQAWNLAYNVSNAFDDYHDKYHWVIEGIKFMQRGTEYNEHEPRLFWDLGWFTSNKIGRADEAPWYRKLFQEDDRFHSTLPSAFRGLRDNWLVGKEWFHVAEERLTPEHTARGLSELVFYSNAPICQFYYADALEKEGHFDDVARRAWQQAEADWREYGYRELPSSYDTAIRLNDAEPLEASAHLAAAELDKLVPGLREKLIAEKRAQLTAEERVACDLPPEKRTAQQFRLAADAQPRLMVSNEELARRVKGAARSKALKLAQEAGRQEELALYIRRERMTINFDYWRTRAAAEQTAELLDARKAAYQGDQAYAAADPETARAAYERSLKNWRKVLDRYAALKEDVSLGEDLMTMIRRYVKCRLDEQLPKPFVLQDIVDKYKDRR